MNAPGMTDARRAGGLTLFVLASIGVYATSLFVLAQPLQRHALEIAVTLDMTLFVPALYWFLLARPRGWAVTTVLPVFIGSLIAASLILPDQRQSALRALELVAVPAELILITLVLRRAAGAVRAGRAHAGSDMVERTHAAVASVIENGRAASIIAFEVTVLWYALLSWRQRAGAAVDSHFSYHRRSGYGSIMAALFLAIAVEMIPVHLLVSRSSDSLAWVVTGLSVYGMIWLLGDLRAVQLRPIVLRPDRLDVRLGLRWSVSIPLDRIASVQRVHGTLVQDPVDLRAALPGAQRVAIRLSAPVEASGIYGIRREIGELEVGVDEPDRLVAALTSRIG